VLNIIRILCAFVACSTILHASANYKGDWRSEREYRLGLEDERPLGLEVRTGTFSPVLTQELCPEGRACVMGSGGGVGVNLEYHGFRDGWVPFVAYDAWFLDSQGVYEIAILQMLGVGLRYNALPLSRAHPYFEVSGGGLLLSDTLDLVTGGGYVSGQLGVEWELNERVTLFGSAGVRPFVVKGFTSESDGIVRGEGFVWGLAVTAQLGVRLLLFDPD